MIGAVAAILVGLVALALASEWFVIGAKGISLRAGLPPIVVGAVVIGFGTSAPELLTSTFAASQGSHDIAFGNLVGSNLANLTLVLGAIGLLAAPTIASGVLRREVPIMVAAMVALSLVLPNVSRIEGVVLVVLFAATMVLLLRRTARDEADVLAAEAELDAGAAARQSWRFLGAMVAVGLVGTVAGAQFLVTGARSVADRLDIGEGLVGFTIVAIATSLPELVTAIQASRHGQPDIAVGNVLGSNLFNSLAIGGIVALAAPGSISGGLVAASWISVAVGVAVWVMLWTSRRLVRWEAVALLVAYAATVPVTAG